LFSRLTVGHEIGEGVVISLFAGAKREAERKLDQGIRDRTQELEAAYRQLSQSEALAALGTGISKIAHEMANRVQSLSGQIQLVVSRLLWKKRKAYSLGIRKNETGSWGESDRGGIRLWEKVSKDWGQWKSYSVGIGWPKRYGEKYER
jgi:hypothetical protein